MKLLAVRFMIPAAMFAACLAGCESGGQTRTDEPSQQLDTVQVEVPAPIAEPEPAVAQAEEQTPAEVEVTQAVEASPGPEATAPAVTDASGSWWLQTPAAVEGRVRLVSGAEGGSVRASRRAAVDAGFASLAKLLGAEPDDVVVERVTVVPGSGGVFHAFVLVSCKAS